MMHPGDIADAVDSAAVDAVKAEFASFYTQLVSGVPLDEAAERVVKGLTLLKAAHERMRAEAVKVFTFKP